MPWSGGSYTKGNNATGGWTGDASLGIGIEAGRHDTQDNDFATGINQCLNKDGSNPATADLNLGGFRPANIASGTAAAPAICAGNDVNTGVFGPAADTWAVATNGSERLRVTSTGLVGIGTTAPVSSLEVAKSSSGDDVVFSKYEAGAQGAVFNLRKSRSNSIGTNTIVANGDGLGEIYFSGANGTGYTIGAVINGKVDGTPGATNDMPGRLEFYTTADGSGSPTERMRITSAGRIGINTINPQSVVSIFNNENALVSTGLFQSNVTGDLTTHALRVAKFDNDTTTSQRFIGFAHNAGADASGQINANGAGQAAFGSFSDERLKKNIVNLPTQLANIMAMRPVEFDYKDGSGHQIGFIAQEIQQIYPDLIGDQGDGFLTLSGLGKNEARMIKAFQEFAELTQATITALQARVAALEA